MLTRCGLPITPPRRRPHGLSVIELLVGMAVGLIVVGGAVGAFVGHLGGSRQLLNDTRLNQDLRNAVDLITRDLRRAGYWGHAIQGTIPVSATLSAAANPYRAATTPSSSEIAYDFSRDELAAGGVENDIADGSDRFGLRLYGGALQMQAGDGTWTALTDTKSVTITGFAITPTSTTLPLGDLCPRKCLPGTPNCPTVTVRKYAVLIQGQSVKDASLTRDLRTEVRVRNDRLEGACPA